MSQLETDEFEGIPFGDVPDDELSDDELHVKYAPRVLGPVWSKDGNGDWSLPERTLGWGVIAWCTRWLNPLDPDRSDVFKLTLEQVRWILWWYAVDDNGEFLYRSAVLQRIKGWGKDPLIAVLCLVEAFGPSQFIGWDGDGQPIGRRRPNAWVQVYAVAKEQTRNTMGMFPILMSERLKKRYGIDPGVELIYGCGRTVLIEAKTSSYRAAEGGRVTFVVMNETQHWLESNNGWALRDTAEANAGKIDGRYVAITNAPKPGEESVAEKDRAAYVAVLEGRAEDAKVFYDSIEAPDHTPLTERVFKLVYRMVRGDSHWCNPDRAWVSAINPSRPTAESRRMYLNQVWQPEGSLYSSDEIERIRTSNTLSKGDMICLGFDGGKSDDSTALVAIRVRDGLIVPLVLEEKPMDHSDQWVVDADRVDAAVHRAFRDYRVVGFYADVNLWESHIHEWSLDYAHSLAIRASEKNAVAFDMRGSKKRMTTLHESFMDSILNERVRFGPDPYGNHLDDAFRRHCLNAARRDTTWGVSFMKTGGRESAKKVDMYAAAMLAFVAMQEYQQVQAMHPAREPSALTMQRY